MVTVICVNMIVVINAGGSGSRLWPLSTPKYPKHLLKLEGTDGAGSLVQNTYNRIKDYTEYVYFITEAGHSHRIKEQLPELEDEQIIIEPARRGTASCIIFALTYINERHGKSIPLAFINADHVIHDHEAFRDALAHSTQTALKHNGITLFGVEPSYPATGFGYIEKGEKISLDEEIDVHEVAMFKEKPDRKTAEKYIKEGKYYWNSGNFAGPLKVWEETMKKDVPKLFDFYLSLCQAKGKEKEKIYLSAKEDSIDYALMEPAKRLLVVPGTFDWIDIGSYQDLYSISHQDEDANAIQGDNIATYEVSNSLIRNETTKKIGVIGLDNLAVIVTEEGIVIANRNKSQNVKDVVNNLNKNK